MSRRKRSTRNKRRTQAEILLSVFKSVPSRKPQSISSISKKSKSTWRTVKQNLDTLRKTGLVERVKPREKKRVKYRRAS